MRLIIGVEVSTQRPGELMEYRWAEGCNAEIVAEPFRLKVYVIVTQAHQVSRQLQAATMARDP
jgi:hypothetical protein